MKTSVATTPIGRAGNEPADSAAAVVQGQRLPQLLDDVAAGALCASKAPGIPELDEWYRGDGEPLIEWRRRRAGLVQVCAACPVREACAESALRQGEGSLRATDDMVRGGMTGTELYQARTDQAMRLAAARTEDGRVAREERQLRRLVVQLQALALVHRDSRSDARVNANVRAKADELHVARHARRARSGWTSAA